jgi:hypothetical protein
MRDQSPDDPGQNSGAHHADSLEREKKKRVPKA